MYEALLAASLLTARPQPHVPAEVLAAKQEVMARAHAASAAATPAPLVWQSLGPVSGQGGSPDSIDVDSGRVNAIVVDPTDSATIYVATAGGGVWKCTNANPANDDWIWVPLTDDLVAATGDGSIAVGALAISPIDHLTLWLAFGDKYEIGGNGIGMYVTHDGGTTWTRLAGDLGGATHPREILALDNSTLLVTSETGLWRSTNGGTSFTNASLSGISQYESWSAERPSPTALLAPAALVASVVDYGTSTGSMWWSSDAGASWSPASLAGAVGTPGRIILDTAPGASATEVRGVYEDLSTYNQGDYAAKGILHSSDAGHTYSFGAVASGLFDSESGDGTAAFYSMMLTVDPADPTKMFAGTSLAFYRSTDDGVTWTQMSEWYGYGHVYQHADYHSATWAGGTLYVGNDGGLALIRDPYRASVPVGGSYVASDTSFIDNRHNKGLVDMLVYAIGSSIAPDARDLVSAGTQDNGTRVRMPTAGALAGSTRYDETLGGDGFDTLVHAKNGNEVLATFYYGYVYKSTDSGQTFEPAGNGINLNGAESFFTDLEPGYADPSGDTVYHHAYNRVYKSTDFGSNFSALALTGIPGTAYLLGMVSSHHSANTLAVISVNHHGYITHDAANWTPFGALPNSGTLAFQQSFEVIEHPPIGEADGGLDPDGGHAAGYDDADDVWIDSTNDKIIYIASSSLRTDRSHLWKSIDGGASFLPLDGAGTADNGFPYGLPVRGIRNDPRSSKVLYAGTEVGLYQSKDAGATWTRYGSGLPWVAVYDLYLAPDATFMRVGTYGRGVWEIPLEAVSGAKKKKGCSCDMTPGDLPSPAVLLLALGAVATLRRRR